MLRIDGEMGEGGGQVLRTSLTLSSLTGIPVQVDNIRAKRRKPGLLRQHLTAAQALSEICDADIEGARLGSRSLTFRPREARAGNYHFAIGTAGSTSLVLQTLLLPLAMAKGRSVLYLEGGTHNPLAPPFEFLETAYLPTLTRMGLDIRVELERVGFAPAGGGKIKVTLGGHGRLNQPFHLVEQEPFERLRLLVILSRLPRDIAEREIRVVAKRFPQVPMASEIRTVESDGPGNILFATAFLGSHRETFSGFGKVGRPAEAVARSVARDLQAYLRSGAPVSEHLADQLLLPLALASEGMFRTANPSLHTKTNLDVIEAFLPGRVQAEEGPEGVLYRAGDSI